MIRLRPAGASDATTLLAWRNDPETRAMSFNQAPVLADEHTQWLQRVLRSPDERLYIAERDDDGRAVGVGRLTHRPPGVVEVSLTVAPERRGEGLARHVIEALVVRALGGALGPCDEVHAHVRPENQRSIRAFTAAGFASSAANAGRVTLSKKVERHADAKSGAPRADTATVPSSIGVAVCAHHKPWLAMSTVVTALAQSDQHFEICFIQNRGDGRRHGSVDSWYGRLAAVGADNWHLSDYDPRVAAVCAIKSDRVRQVAFENDHGLDSGAFYKFLLGGHADRWSHVLLCGEGALLARRDTLAALREVSARPDVHFVQSAHELRCLPKSEFLRYHTRHGAATDLDRFHDEMIGETFAIFQRDPDFARVFAVWSDAVTPETQYHVPAIPPRTALARRVRRSMAQRWGVPGDGRGVGLLGRVLRRSPYAVDRLAARAALAAGWRPTWPAADAGDWGGSVEAVTTRGVQCRKVAGVEWFGCTPTVLVSQLVVRRLRQRFDRFRLHEALELPFAATALEVMWGLMPAWLGVDKWFTDGFHRVRKDPVTYRREDTAPDLASYINRYYRGRLVMGWRDAHVTVEQMSRELRWFQDVLPSEYFAA